MLTTVAALVIVLGLMVSLARFVRQRAAEQFTNELLVRLDSLAAQYKKQTGAWPRVTAFVPELPAATQPAGVLVPADEPALPPESILRDRARQNNRDAVSALRQLGSASVGKWPLWGEEGDLLDAWGRPIVFMPAMRPPIGMAPGDQPFFLSAGPDGIFTTLEDNIYSYEVVPAPAMAPLAGG